MPEKPPIRFAGIDDLHPKCAFVLHRKIELCGPHPEEVEYLGYEDGSILPLSEIVYLQWALSETLNLYNIFVGGADVIPEIAPSISGDGYVYLAHSDTGHYKIGRSKTPEGRIKVFDTQMPVEVTLQHCFPADDYIEAEAALHERYAEHRVKGEWFTLPDEAIDEIQSIRHYMSRVFACTHVPGDGPDVTE